MKRTLSDEYEPVAKHSRFSISSLLSSPPSVEINRDNNSNSQNNEITHENFDDPIIVISDTESNHDNDEDEDIDIAGDIEALIDSLLSPCPLIPNENHSQTEFNATSTSELIDLTDDRSSSPVYVSSDDDDDDEQQSLNDIDECPICLETLTNLQSLGIYLIITQCNHVMCTSCSQKLLAKSTQCPLCRKTISETTLMPYYVVT